MLNFGIIIPKFSSQSLAKLNSLLKKINLYSIVENTK